MGDIDIKVNIKCSTGSTFSVEVNLGQTVAQFKESLTEKVAIPAAQQRLIYSGHVLKDFQTLASYCEFPPSIRIVLVS